MELKKQHMRFLHYFKEDFKNGRKSKCTINQITKWFNS